MPAAKKCPICGRPAAEEFKPFCSRRCADIDLNRWLSGSYVIPARDDESSTDNDNPASGDDDEF